MDCGVMSRGGCVDGSASAVSGEGFGGDVEARRSSQVRFSSCSLETIISSLLAVKVLKGK